MADKSSKKVQAQYKNDYDKHGQFKPRFAMGDYLFFELPPLKPLGANWMFYEGYLKLLHRLTGPYRVISIAPSYAMIY